MRQSLLSIHFDDLITSPSTPSKSSLIITRSLNSSSSRTSSMLTAETTVERDRFLDFFLIEAPTADIYISESLLTVICRFLLDLAAIAF